MHKRTEEVEPTARVPRILKFSFVSRGTRLDNTNANENNCGIHLTNTLF